MVGKNNYKTRTQKAANKKQRFSLKKLSVGVASVAVGTTLFLGNAEGVSADENSDATTTDDAQGQSAVGSGYDFNEPEFDWSEADQVYEREQEEKAQELQAAKEAAIAEVQAAGFTDEKYAGWINAQETVQDVNAVKREILTTVPNEEQSGIEGATSVDSEHDFNAPEIDWSEADQAYEREQEQKAQELQAAKEAAIAEVQAAGFTDEKYAGWINAQETVQDVNAVKREILTTVPNEEQSGIEGETSVDSEYDFNAPEIDWSGADQAYDREQEENQPIEGETSVDSVYDFLAPDFDWSGLEEAVAEEEAQEEVYTLYYYGQRTQNQNGATTVKASSPREALEYFQNFLSERGLDAGDFNWHYESKDRVFTASEKIEGEASVDSEYDFVRPDIDWSGADQAVAEEEAQEEVYTLYYYGQRTQNQNGATTVKASSPREALEYFQNFLSERGLDAGDFNWHYESKGRVFTASEKIEGEASVDSEYDFVRPDFDWSDLEEAIQDEENQEAVYTFVYITQNTKGKNGATTVKASSPEEALEYFQNWAKENDLGELDWSYDEDTKTFTGREKLEDDSDDDSGDAGEEKPGQDDSDSDDSTEDETDEEGKDGSDEADDTTSDDSEDQKPGQDAPVKPGKGSEGPVATPVKDSKQASGQKAPVGQASGQAQASSQKPAKEAGQTLPDTATSTWALGLLGLTSLAGGLFAGKNKED